MLQAKANVGYGGVNMEPEFLTEETIKWHACDGEINTTMKQTSIKSIK